MTHPPNCYGVRRLNPFLGVIQVVDIGDARALSEDGVHWEIQVLAAQPEHDWRSPNRFEPVMRFFRFGVWEPEAGLRRVPVSPILDLDAMLAGSEALIEALSGCLEQFPFALGDFYELWLLDTRQRPIALVASTANALQIRAVRPDPWSATILSDHSFHSVALSAAGVPERLGHNPREHASRLEKLVRDGAGHPPRQCWFQRSQDGSGVAVNPDSVEPSPETSLPDSEFPPLLLRQDWRDDMDTALVQNYLAWCAPRLLTLTNLDDVTRGWLEQEARSQALLIESYYRLYPKVVHKELIDTARVEARLRRQ